MANPHGTPIWYELMTKAPDAAKVFYDDVVGWTMSPGSDAPGMDYRMIACGDGGHVGGVLPLTDAMTAGGAKPTWLTYIGVDYVDATAGAIVQAGGAVHMPPFDIPGAGRAAMVADPQGNTFYIMRGSSPEDSTAWSETAMGRCSWNELVTPDQDAGDAFYAQVFGWTYPHSMPMGPMGDYRFVDAAGQSIGATMRTSEGQPQGWCFYFRAPDIDAAADKVRAGGGTIHAGPMEVPGGDRIIVASDPEGVRFGVVAPGNPEA